MSRLVLFALLSFTIACSNTTTGVTLAPLGTLTLYYAVQVQQ